MQFSSPSVARSHLPHRSFLLQLFLSRLPPAITSVHYETPCGMHPPTAPLVIPNLKSSPATTASSLLVPCVMSGPPLFSHFGLGCRFSEFGSFFCTAAPSHLDPILSFFLSFFLYFLSFFPSPFLSLAAVCALSQTFSPPPNTALTTSSQSLYSHPTYERRPLHLTIRLRSRRLWEWESSYTPLVLRARGPVRLPT